MPVKSLEIPQAAVTDTQHIPSKRLPMSFRQIITNPAFTAPVTHVPNRVEDEEDLWDNVPI